VRRVVDNKKSTKIIKAAKCVLVGGVNSPVRSFSYVGGDPIPIYSGRGSRICDYDHNWYIDYVLSYGALILGHTRPEVMQSIKQTADLGVGFGATHKLEVELAERIKAAIPLLKKIRFVSSGTEAVMGAVRLARGVTGRSKIIKFERSYHGHADYLLKKAGSGLATMELPLSKGVPKSLLQDTIIARYGDRNEIDKIFAKFGPDIAAILVEPVGGNDGVVLPDKNFLKILRRITKRYGTLLIFDEVITGFRFHFGSAAAYFGIRPDIICLGKIIGGGLPIGAYGGSKRVMDQLAPLGGVYQASTFAGNPVVMSAGLSTLKVLASSRRDYRRLDRLALYLSRAVLEEARKQRIDLSIRQFKGIFSIHFKKKSHFKVFYRELLNAGVYLAPSEHESNFISFAHTKKDIDKTIGIAKKALCLLK